MKKVKVLILCTAILMTACSYNQQHITGGPNSPLTNGNIEMNIVVGRTTKAQILETFGAPNITTRDSSGEEVWSYQRAAQVTQSSGHTGYWTIILGGQSNSVSGFESTSRMTTLIVKFNNRDIVSDFRSRTSDF